MDTKTLISVMSGDYPAPTADVDYAAMTKPFNQALILANCNTAKRVAMFASQVGPESGMLRWMAELADGSAYEWREDLGNTQAGDGKKFKGGGPIQLTGRHNYTKFSQWAWTNRARIKSVWGLTITSADMFVTKPQLVQTRHDYGFLAAVWYWTVARDMNSYADRGDINGASTAVNGANPANNLSGRRKVYFHALTLGDKLLPVAPALDPMEEIMAYYKDKAAFEAALHAIVKSEVRSVLYADTDDDGKLDKAPRSVRAITGDAVDDGLKRYVPLIAAAVAKEMKKK